MLISPNCAKMRGNVLFIILIAVALFAALTTAITQSNRGTNSLDRERGTIGASDLMSYGAGLEKAVARMMSDGSISENGLSFENDIWLFNNGNPTAPASQYANCTTDRCKVFHPAGGGMHAQTFGAQELPTPAGTEVRSGHAAIWNIQVTGVGTSDRDLVFIIATIDQNTCKSINDHLNITNPSGFPPADNWDGALRYDGTFDGPSDTTATIGNLATQLHGKTAGCVSRQGGAYGGRDNYFYQVLLPR